MADITILEDAYGNSAKLLDTNGTYYLFEGTVPPTVNGRVRLGIRLPAGSSIGYHIKWTTGPRLYADPIYGEQARFPTVKWYKSKGKFQLGGEIAQPVFNENLDMIIMEVYDLGGNELEVQWW